MSEVFEGVSDQGVSMRSCWARIQKFCDYKLEQLAEPQRNPAIDRCMKFESGRLCLWWRPWAWLLESENGIDYLMRVPERTLETVVSEC
jgi:hypothetical protein